MGVISPDTSKAFDSLLPALMIKKLEVYNFLYEWLQLLRSYFQERQGRVKLPTFTSVWHNLRKGCPKVRALDPCCGK